MQKETLTLDAIKKDLKLIIDEQYSNKSERWIFAMLYLTMATVGIGVLLKDAIPAILFFLLLGTYPIWRYVKERRTHSTNRKALLDTWQRGQISITVLKFSHKSEELIYEPHYHAVLDDAHSHKPIHVYYFENGASWRIPSVWYHYKWSKEFNLTPKGLDNLAYKGSEFFFVRLQAQQDITYIYPCLMFQLDPSLRKSFP